MVNINAEETERAIREAFADVQRPQRLTQKRDGDANEMDRELTGKAWTVLTVDELMRHRATLSMVDPDAFRFYLPAYLLASLDKERPGYVEDLREATLFALSPYLKGTGPDPGREQRLRARIGSLNRRQRAAVTGYIAFVRTQVLHPKEFSALNLTGFWT